MILLEAPINEERRQLFPRFSDRIPTDKMEL